MGVLLGGLSFLPIFKEGRDVFMSRWTTSTGSNESEAAQNISDRILGGFITPFIAMRRAPAFGMGIGVGSNVGAKLLSGKVGFLLAEDDWSKIFLELGPVLGSAFIGLRVFLTCYLGIVSLLALVRRHEALPLLIFSAIGSAVIQYQWGPPTLLGFAVFGSGMVLAALKTNPVDESLVAETGEERRPEAASLPPPPPPATAQRPAVLAKLSVA
jgi:hypothetical protein